jgi:hypothetical protein
MQHPEKLLRTSGIQAALRILRRKMEEFHKERPEFPASTLTCQVAMSSPEHMKSERAATRELPFVLLGMEKLPILWKMDENFAKAMLATDYPQEHGLSGFRLPYPSIWVQTPPVLHVLNEETGMHDLDGFYLAEDWIPSRAKLLKTIGKDCRISDLDEGLLDVVNQRYTDALMTDPLSVLERAILVVLVGKSKTPESTREIKIKSESLTIPVLDDALISFWVLTEDRFQIEDNVDFMRLVINLLIALQSDYVEEERVVPQLPRGSKRKARAERKGESFAPYSVIKLGKRANTARKASSRGEGSGPDRIIRGHWNYYWVLEQGTKDSTVLDRRPREGKEDLCKVRKWIQPVIIGNPAAKTYLLRK